MEELGGYVFGHAVLFMMLMMMYWRCRLALMGGQLFNCDFAVFLMADEVLTLCRCCCCVCVCASLACSLAVCVPVCTVCVVNEKTDGSQADGSNEQPLAVGGARSIRHKEKGVARVESDASSILFESIQ